MARKFTTSDSFFTADAEEVSVSDYQVPKGYTLKPLPKSERMQILVTKEMKENLKAIATRRNISYNAIVNEALTEYVKQNL